jgi:hypothetical protein
VEDNIIHPNAKNHEIPLPNALCVEEITQQTTEAVNTTKE